MCNMSTLRYFEIRVIDFLSFYCNESRTTLKLSRLTNEKIGQGTHSFKLSPTLDKFDIQTLMHMRTENENANQTVNVPC